MSEATDQIREARGRLLAFRAHAKYPHTGRHYTEFQESLDTSTLADAYLDLAKGEWLEAADSEGWWWHDGVTAPGSVDLVHVFYCEIARCLSYRTPGEIKCPASGGKWQKVIGPFNTKKE